MPGSAGDHEHLHPGGWRTWSADGPERRPADTPGRRTTHGRSAVVGGPAGIPLIPTGDPATAARPSDTGRSREPPATARDPPQGRIRPMRILLWHGYLLGGTGSNVYTRALAREWSRRGARRDRAQPGATPRGVRPRRGRDGAPGRRRVPARLRARPLRGLRGAAAARRAARARRACGSPRTRPPVREHLPADLSTSTTSCWAAPSGQPRARRTSSRRTAPSSSTRCAGTRSWRRGAPRRWRRPRDGRRLRAHPHGRRRGVRSHRPRRRGAARETIHLSKAPLISSYGDYTESISAAADPTKLPLGWNTIWVDFEQFGDWRANALSANQYVLEGLATQRCRRGRIC